MTVVFRDMGALQVDSSTDVSEDKAASIVRVDDHPWEHPFSGAVQKNSHNQGLFRTCSVTYEDNQTQKKNTLLHYTVLQYKMQNLSATLLADRQTLSCPPSPSWSTNGPQRGIILLIATIDKEYQVWAQADFFFLFLASYSLQTRLHNTDNTCWCSRLLLYRRINWPNFYFSGNFSGLILFLVKYQFICPRLFSSEN